MKIGVNLSINVKAIIKERMINHSNGKTYLNMTAFIDIDNQGQYGDNGMITHAKNKDEEGQMKILGNVKVFWKEEGQPQSQAPQQQGHATQQYQGNATQSQSPPPQQGTPPPEPKMDDGDLVIPV